MKTKNSQSGIAHVAVIALVVVVLGVIGFAGWKVWNNNKEEAKTTKSTQQKAGDTKTKVTTKKTSEYDKCLRLDDYKSINDGEPLEYYTGSTDSTMVFEEVLYKPDSTEYADAAAAKASADKYAAFYKSYKDRYWSIELSGEIKDIDGSGSTASNTKLANDRAERFKNDLVSRGIAADKITVDEPRINSDESSRIDNARNVTVRVVSQCKSGDEE